MHEHLFSIGQVVRMRKHHGTSAQSSEKFLITAMLPLAADSKPQYRMRNENEQHDRVATEDLLESVAPLPMAHRQSS